MRLLQISKETAKEDEIGKRVDTSADREVTIISKLDNFGNKRHILTQEDREKGGQVTKGVYEKRGEIGEAIKVWLKTEQRDKNGEILTGAEIMTRVAIREMLKGNPKFWKMLRDTAGQMPVEKIMLAEVEQSVIDEMERLVCGDDENSSGGVST